MPVTIVKATVTNETILASFQQPEPTHGLASIDNLTSSEATAYVLTNATVYTRRAIKEQSAAYIFDAVMVA